MQKVHVSGDLAVALCGDEAAEINKKGAGPRSWWRSWWMTLHEGEWVVGVVGVGGTR